LVGLRVKKRRFPSVFHAMPMMPLDHNVSGCA